MIAAAAEHGYNDMLQRRLNRARKYLGRVYISYTTYIPCFLHVAPAMKFDGVSLATRVKRLQHQNAIWCTACLFLGESTYPVFESEDEVDTQTARRHRVLDAAPKVDVDDLTRAEVPA